VLMGLGFLLPISRGVAEASHTARRAEAKKEGWRLCFRGRLSPARMTTRKCPHGVYKHTRNDRLGQSLFTAARRLWTLFVSRRRSAGAFFCALVVRFRACRSVSPGSRGQPTTASQSKAGPSMAERYTAMRVVAANMAKTSVTWMRKLLDL